MLENDIVSLEGIIADKVTSEGEFSLGISQISMGGGYYETNKENISFPNHQIHRLNHSNLRNNNSNRSNY